MDRHIQYVHRKLREALRQPSFQVMLLAALMCAVKAALKLGIGSHIHSPMITGDGSHNIGDAIEQLVAIVAMLVAGLPASKEYPFGRKNIESFASLIIGAGLLALSFMFVVKSAVGLIASWPAMDQAVRSVIWLPDHQPLILSNATFPWVVAVTAGSAALSLLVSRTQIRVGKRTKNAILEASGTEIKSDARIEGVTLAGVLAEHFLHLPWLEYPLGLFIAYLIARSGWELFHKAWRVLLQHSIGHEHEERIRELCQTVPGVLHVARLKTFQVGQMASCTISIHSRRGGRTNAHIRCGIEELVTSYLIGQEFTECELQIEFHRPEPVRSRVAFALMRKDGSAAIAPDLQAATHLVICDLEDGTIVRTKEQDLPPDPVAFLVRKRVVGLYVFQNEKQFADGLGASNIAVLPATSYLPGVMGLPS